MFAALHYVVFVFKVCSFHQFSLSTLELIYIKSRYTFKLFIELNLKWLQIKTRFIFISIFYSFHYFYSFFSMPSNIFSLIWVVFVDTIRNWMNSCSLVVAIRWLQWLLAYHKIQLFLNSSSESYLLQLTNYFFLTNQLNALQPNHLQEILCLNDLKQITIIFWHSILFKNIKLYLKISDFIFSFEYNFQNFLVIFRFCL